MARQVKECWTQGRLGYAATAMVVLIYLALIIYTLMLSIAYGHEGEQWIADKALHNPISGVFCCGPQDCKQVPDEWVEKVQGGYWLGAEFIPNAQALPFSPDGHYHRCAGPDKRTRCFIVPPPSS